ncbi:NADPH-dependent curcumin reductase [Roseivivax jejudonensis]|uniref:NADPH-dependent curcumin reductase n=1 Tax=Roseivivax jejudonensis TaxID=1529041 RepID=A0A1X7A2Y1_9RHOB|nr:NADP-dependent oxidoreductase [Roseivivax jejudonensis]SLN68919.1 NADPH-dependent curcumin reductase [Roseivivax jejudonensis]
MADQLRRITLARRPSGDPVPEDFALETGDLPNPGAGEVLVAVEHFSLDPYMRGRMDDARSYADPVPIGGTMTAQGVGRVVASNADGLSEGDRVTGMTGWASHAVLKASEARRIDDGVPPTSVLGVLGMPGFTGWYGLNDLGRPKAGETLVVAAATGPVGSMVGQLAKAAGLRTVAIAGGADKCALARDAFGFDAAIDHRAHDDARSLRAAIAEAAPDGVDIYFENVGGKVLEAVVPLMNTFGRIPVCGMVAWYGGVEESEDRLPMLWRSVLVKRMSVSGFIIADHWDRFDAFLSDVAPRVAKGEIDWREDVAEGLDHAPETFIRMLKGGNTGKQIMKI